MQEFKDDMWAPSSRRVMEAKIATVEKMLRFWKHTLLPLTREKVLALGTALKLGGYRSATSYLAVYRGFAERDGQDLASNELRA